MARIYYDKRIRFWCLDYRDFRGVRRQVKGARTKTLAEALLRKSLDDVSKANINGGKVIKPIILDKFADEYLAYSQATNKFNTHKREKSLIKNLLKAFSGRILTSIATREIEKYKAERRLKASPQTVNHELAALKKMFTKAHQWGFASSYNPVKEVKFYKVNNTIVRWLEPRERELLLACCGTY